jgi:hypothetical protein
MPLATSTGEASGKTWQLVGSINAMSGQFWTIAGIPVRVTDSTRVRSDVPISIGTTVAASGIVDTDGTRVATDVSAGSVLDSAMASATPASTLVATDHLMVNLPFVAVAVTAVVPRPSATRKVTR